MDRRYWDSDCFLGWLLAESDKAPQCGQVLEEAQIGNVQIITSALTIAEVLVLRGRPRLPPSDRGIIERFFRNDYIVVRSVTRRISEMARDLVWDYGIAPKDAVHVATAMEAKLALLNTFDGELLKRSGAVGEPKLLIDRPALAQLRLNLPLRTGDDD